MNITGSSVTSYMKADEWCQNVVNRGHDMFFSMETFDSELKRAAAVLNFPIESLNSFLRNVHLQRVKKTSASIRSKLSSNIVDSYMSGASILSLAKKYNYPPTLLARVLIENITVNKKKNLTSVLKDPLSWLNSTDVLIEKYRGYDFAMDNKTLLDPFSGKPLVEPSQKVHRLALEVLEAVNSDPIYAPHNDKERQYIGMEYEIILEKALRAMNIPFETENELRVKGTSRTPDVLLSCPVAVKVNKKFLPSIGKADIAADAEDSDYVWKMICWIDSKALYGNVKMHISTVLPQAETYVHRFGPGLVLYWFGHAPVELLEMDKCHDVVIMGWDIPKEFMLPTGNIVRHGFCISNLHR